MIYMSIEESSVFENDIYELQTSDRALGGRGGVANRQAEQLANRTRWLKDQLALLNDQHIKSAVVDNAGHLIFTLGDDSTVDLGNVRGATGVGMPAGGLVGQMPVKKSGGDYDFEWQDKPGDGVGVASVTIDGRGHLIITLTDSSVIDAGEITGGGGTAVELSPLAYPLDATLEQIQAVSPGAKKITPDAGDQGGIWSIVDGETANYYLLPESLLNTADLTKGKLFKFDVTLPDIATTGTSGTSYDCLDIQIADLSTGKGIDISITTDVRVSPPKYNFNIVVDGEGTYLLDDVSHGDYTIDLSTTPVGSVAIAINNEAFRLDNYTFTPSSNYIIMLTGHNIAHLTDTGGFGSADNIGKEYHVSYTIEDSGSLAPVAVTGKASYMVNPITIPKNISAFENNVGYLTVGATAVVITDTITSGTITPVIGVSRSLVAPDELTSDLTILHPIVENVSVYEGKKLEIILTANGVYNLTFGGGFLAGRGLPLPTQTNSTNTMILEFNYRLGSWFLVRSDGF